MIRLEMISNWETVSVIDTVRVATIEYPSARSLSLAVGLEDLVGSGLRVRLAVAVGRGLLVAVGLGELVTVLVGEGVCAGVAVTDGLFVPVRDGCGVGATQLGSDVSSSTLSQPDVMAVTFPTVVTFSKPRTHSVNVAVV
jgi:hypothetical protein